MSTTTTTTTTIVTEVCKKVQKNGKICGRKNCKIKGHEVEPIVLPVAAVPITTPVLSVSVPIQVTTPVLPVPIPGYPNMSYIPHQQLGGLRDAKVDFGNVALAGGRDYGQVFLKF